MATADIPFRLDRASRKTLVQQLTDALRKSIVGGTYEPGSVLPTLQSIAEATGVSMIVARQAMRRLADEGLVIPRPGVGSVVPKRGQKVLKGHLLVVVPGDNEMYYVNVLVGALQARLLKDGYQLTVVSAPWVGEGDVDVFPLKLAFAQSYDLALAIWPQPKIIDVLANNGIPYVVFREALCESEGCVGTIRYLDNGAVPEFALHCRSAGVRSVWQFRLHDVGPNAVELLRSFGIEATERIIDFPANCTHPLEGAAQSGMKFFDDFFRSHGKHDLPDVLLFADDYVASGAILSLMAHAVRIPEDVRLVSLRNKGLGLIYPKVLTRMEFDGRSHADRIAAYLKMLLGGEKLPEDAGVSPVYIVGETFQ